MNQLESTYRSQEMSSTASTYQPHNNEGDALSPIIFGILALIVGWFFFGIPLSIAAINFGRKAVAAGSKFAGGLLLIAAWAELILTIWFVFLVPA